MSVAALKEEAIRQFALKVEATNDEAVLGVVINFLNGIHAEENNGINLSRHYETIKEDYASVLKKLAE